MIDIDLLNQAVDNVRSLLKDALLTTDIWRVEDGLSLAGYNPQPAAVALFSQILQSMQFSMETSGFPKINRFFMLDLANSKTVLIIRHGPEMMQSIMLDTTKANLGLLVSVVLPRAIADVAKAIGKD